MLQQWINNIKVANYTNDPELFETIVAKLDGVYSNVDHGQYTDLRITGCAPQREPFESWEHAGVWVFDDVVEAVESGAKTVWVKDLKHIYAF